MTLKSDEKVREKLTCGFKYDMRNLVDFPPTTQKSKNFTLMGYFCIKYMMLEAKNTEKLSFMALNSDAKFEETRSLWLLKWHEKLGEHSLKHSKV